MYTGVKKNCVQLSQRSCFILHLPFLVGGVVVVIRVPSWAYFYIFTCRYVHMYALFVLMCLFFCVLVTGSCPIGATGRRNVRVCESQ